MSIFYKKQGNYKIKRLIMPEKTFQDLVFAKTKLIPRGKVSTYKLVAKAIGHPRAARAVGNALNKNHDTKVPCHRVVRSDGSVGGFRDGTVAKNKNPSKRRSNNNQRQNFA